MELENAIKLIDKGVESKGQSQTWADLGAGSGLFSKALSSLLPDKSIIYAVDKSYKNGQQFIGDIIAVKKDFTAASFEIPVCDGILMGNSLHFVEDKLSFLRRIKTFLQPKGRIIIVEYDTDQPNHWVPWPISCKNLQQFFEKHGLGSLQKLATERSGYQSGGIYSAVIIFEG